jgi:hypothetical protein
VVTVAIEPRVGHWQSAVEQQQEVGDGRTHADQRVAAPSRPGESVRFKSHDPFADVVDASSEDRVESESPELHANAATVIVTSTAIIRA